MDDTTLWTQIAAARPTLILRRARLFARIHRPHELIEAESYDVDLSRQRFAVIWGGATVSVATAQLIATYIPAERDWLWGDRNPSTDPVASAAVAGSMAIVPELAPLRAERALRLTNPNDAHDLADWISLRAGYEAMYPAQVGTSIAYLAITFTEHRGQAIPSPATWCIVCGHLACELSGKIIGGPGGRGLCEACAQNPIAVLEDALQERPALLAEAAQQEPPDAPLADFVCVFCEARKPRMMFPETAICWGCVAIVRDIVAPSA